MNDKKETEDYLAIYHSNDSDLNLNSKDSIEHFDCLPEPDPYYNSKVYAIFRFNNSDAVNNTN